MKIWEYSFRRVKAILKKIVNIFTYTRPYHLKVNVVDSYDRFEHVVDQLCKWIVLEKLFTDQISKVHLQNLLENGISSFYKGINKEFPYFKQKTCFLRFSSTLVNTWSLLFQKGTQRRSFAFLNVF